MARPHMHDRHLKWQPSQIYFILLFIILLSFAAAQSDIMRVATVNLANLSLMPGIYVGSAPEVGGSVT